MAYIEEQEKHIEKRERERERDEGI